MHKCTCTDRQRCTATSSSTFSMFLSVQRLAFSMLTHSAMEASSLLQCSCKLWKSCLTCSSWKWKKRGMTRPIAHRGSRSFSNAVEPLTWDILGTRFSWSRKVTGNITISHRSLPFGMAQFPGSRCRKVKGLYKDTFPRLLDLTSSFTIRNISSRVLFSLVLSISTFFRVVICLFLEMKVSVSVLLLRLWQKQNTKKGTVNYFRYFNLEIKNTRFTSLPRGRFCNKIWIILFHFGYFLAPLFDLKGQTQTGVVKHWQTRLPKEEMHNI